MKIKKGLYILLAILAIGVGLYPLVFLLMGLPFGLLDSKGDDLLASIFWNTSFYTHITFGGIALLIGWVQFSKKMRVWNIQVHRLLGKVYVLSVLLSALGGIYIGFFAMGGLITSVGFISLGIIWFYSTLKAYLDIRAKDIIGHEKMMVYSYAGCLAAVTLRLWLPLLEHLFGDFEIAYKIVAWWCWVPNLLVAHFMIIKKSRISLNTQIANDKDQQRSPELPSTTTA